jgi:hypothetical protein
MSEPNDTQTPRRRKGFWRWLIDLFRRPPNETPTRPEKPQPVTTPVVFRETRTGEPLTVPAKGGVFNFVVHYDITFSVSGIPQETLTNRAAAYLQSSIPVLRNKIWSIGREFPPHHPVEAEKAMNAALKEPWCFEEHGNVVSCHAVARVTSDDALIAKQRPAWERLVALDAARQAELHRIDYVTELFTAWLDLFKKFGTAPAVIQAAMLTDREVSGVLRDLAGMEIAMGTDLINVLERVGAAHAKVGLYEFAKSYDLAVRTFEQKAGLNPGTISQGLSTEGK